MAYSMIGGCLNFSNFILIKKDDRNNFVNIHLCELA